MAEHAKAEGAEQRRSPCLINSPLSFNFDPLEAGRENNFPGQREAEAYSWREIRMGRQHGLEQKEEEMRKIRETLYVRQEGRGDVFVSDI